MDFSDLSDIFAMGGDLGSASILSGMFGGPSSFDANKLGNPSDSAMPYFDKISGMMKGYMEPYINEGRDADKILQGQYSQLLNDPASIYNKLGMGFQQSPGYQFQVDQAQNAANRSGAAGGMLGTPAQQQSVANTVGQMANQDYGNYMNRVTGLYNTGLGGYGHVSDRGFDASNSLSQNLANTLMSQGQLAYSGQQNKNQMAMYQNQQDQQKQGGIMGMLSGAMGNMGNMFGGGSQGGGGGMGGMGGGGQGGGMFGGGMFGGGGGQGGQGGQNNDGSNMMSSIMSLLPLLMMFL